MEKGLQKGIKKWKQESIKDGLEKENRKVLSKEKKKENKGEYNVKLETDKNMLQKGLDIELISQCTDLYIDVLNKLQLNKS